MIGHATRLKAGDLRERAPDTPREDVDLTHVRSAAIVRSFGAHHERIGINRQCAAEEVPMCRIVRSQRFRLRPKAGRITPENAGQAYVQIHIVGIRGSNNHCCGICIHGAS